MYDPNLQAQEFREQRLSQGPEESQLPILRDQNAGNLKADGPKQTLAKCFLSPNSSNIKLSDSNSGTKISGYFSLGLKRPQKNGEMAQRHDLSSPNQELKKNLYG